MLTLGFFRNSPVVQKLPDDTPVMLSDPIDNSMGPQPGMASIELTARDEDGGEDYIVLLHVCECDSEE